MTENKKRTHLNELERCEREKLYELKIHDNVVFNSNYKAPDGGYGWVVVFCYFLANFISGGIAYCSGIFFNVWVEYFQCSRGTIALISNSFMGFLCMSGPFASILINNYGSRRTTFIGGLMLTFGSILASMATSLIVLFIGFSFIGGCGAGFVAISSYGSTSYYFDGNRAKAIGLQQTGIGVGLLALPIFFNYLFHEYSWRGALLIFGGIAGNICVLSLLIKSLPNEPSQLNRRKNLKRRELYMKNAEYHDYHLNQLNVLIDQNCGNGPEENIMKEKIENMKHISKSCEDCNDNYLSLQANEDNLDMFDGTVPINFRRSPASTMHSCDTTKTEDHYKSFISLPENVTRMVRPKLFYLRWLLPETREMIKGTFNLKLFKNWKYVLVLISACIRSLGVYGPFLYLVEMAENDNVDPARAPLIISGLGIANMISRCTTGILLDSKIIGPVSLEILLSFILAMILAIPTFVCHTLSSYIIYATVYGLAFGASAMLIAILLIHIVGLDSFTNANGFYYMSISFPIISGSYLTGWVRDLSEGYTNTFFLCSALLVVSGLTLLPVLWHDHYGGKNKGTNS